MRRLILPILFFVFSCGEKPVPDQDSTESLSKSQSVFTLLTSSETGLDFVNNVDHDLSIGFDALSYWYYYNGGGVGIGDLNNDGLPDVVLTANRGRDRVYQNLGDLRFQDVTESSGIEGDYWSNGVSLADIDGDGLLDIYISVGGPSAEGVTHANRCFLNQGDFRFTEQADKMGIADGGRTTQSGFFDFDEDGDLDLFVMNHSTLFGTQASDVDRYLSISGNLEKTSSQLYENDGSNSFKNITAKAGVLNYGYGLGLLLQDLNGDGLTDIYQANDFSVPDFMYINQGDGTFADELKERTKQIAWFGMGVDAQDLDNDGNLDLAVVDMAAADHIRSKTSMPSMDVQKFESMVKQKGYQYQTMFNAINLSNGDGSYRNVSHYTGMGKTDWSWAVLMKDYDLDGLTEVYVTNGYRRNIQNNDFGQAFDAFKQQQQGDVPISERTRIYDQIPELRLPNFMYDQEQKLKFRNVSANWGMAQPSFSNGAAYGDLDNDGDLDIVVNNIDELAFVYRNNTTELRDQHYLKILPQSSDNVIDLNSKVWVIADSIRLVQEVHGVRGFQASTEVAAHFGLGSIGKVDTVVVEWSNGTTGYLTDLPSDTTLVVSPNQLSNYLSSNGNKAECRFETVNPESIGLDYRHAEEEFDDYSKQVLLPHRQSTLGPFITAGDVNGDGLDDLYVGGAKGQNGVMFVQQSTGKFVGQKLTEGGHEDMGVHFFDFDGDDDLDLYVTSGSASEFDEGKMLQDRIYRNTGGKFELVSGVLPEMHSSSMCVSSSDFDGDGDLDLFVGGGSSAHAYPRADRSYLLENEDGAFEDVTSELCPDLMVPGMVTDAVWEDISNDGTADLVICGEWMEVQLYLNDGSGVLTRSNDRALSESGWFYSLLVKDLNGDGRKDIVAGNIGENTKFKASKAKPFHVFMNDMDDNGTNDVVLSYDYNGGLVPSRGRECSSQQVPGVARKYPSFSGFASASLEQVYGKEKLSEAIHLEATSFKSVCLMQQENGSFSPVELPFQLQTASSNRILELKIDGKDYLFAAGNKYNAEVETPRYDSGIGTLLKVVENEASPLRFTPSCIRLHQNIKDVALVQTNTGKLLIATENNGPLRVYKVE